MDRISNRRMPRKRQEELLVHELADDLLVYDLKRHKAHSLNKTAALVWSRCDGESKISDTVASLEQEVGASVDQSVVYFALQQLDRANLLIRERGANTEIESRISRRQLVGKLGLAAAASLPLIVSLVSPATAQASCRPRDAACTLDSECCSGNCRGNNLCA